MGSNLNISIALTVFMAIASGGLLSLVLMSTRKQQTSFSLMLGLTLILALLGATGAASEAENVPSGLSTTLVLLILSLAFGYVLTTYSVLAGTSTPRKREPEPAEGQSKKVAAILLSQGEPPNYEVRSAAQRFELADDRADVPPVLRLPSRRARRSG